MSWYWIVLIAIFAIVSYGTVAYILIKEYIELQDEKTKEWKRISDTVTYVETIRSDESE